MAVRMAGQQSRSGGVGNRRFLLFIALVFFGGYVLFWLNEKIAYLNNPSDKSEAKLFYDHTIKHATPWEIAIQEAKGLLNATEDNDLPSCLVPDKKKTLALVSDILFAAKNSRTTTTNTGSLLPLPVMNMGMPKSGSTTLYEFFDCIGFRATHWDRGTTDFEGMCMRDAANVGLPPIATCGPDVQAFMQFDVEYPFGTNGGNIWSKKKREECFFPQLSLLEELHAEDPNATFVMNFRPIGDWIRSLTDWKTDWKPSMLERFQLCHFPNLPRGFPQNLTDEKDVRDTMSQFFCSHVQHLRNFVKEHPSHTLIELDLYDNQGSSTIMGALFPSSNICWGHSNKSERKPPLGKEKKKPGSG